MSQPSRSTPILDRPGHAALGRKAVLGALVCVIIGIASVWAVGTRVWQMIQPATVTWDDVPMAEEIPPDRVNDIVQGKVDGATLSDNSEPGSDNMNRGSSRIAEERRLLSEMFPRLSQSRSDSNRQEQRSDRPVRSAAENRMAKLPNPIPDLEVSIPEPAATNLEANRNGVRPFENQRGSDPVSAAATNLEAIRNGVRPFENQRGSDPVSNKLPAESVSVTPKSNSQFNSIPWRGTGDAPTEKPDPPKVSESPVSPQSRFGMEAPSNNQPSPLQTAPPAGNKLQFPSKFSGHSTVLPSASMRPPRLIQSSEVKTNVADEQVEQAVATSPISVLTDALAESVQKLQPQPAAVSVMNVKQNREHENDDQLVTVEDGDSFWTIAQRVYGDGNWFQAIYFENRETVGDFDRLEAGRQLNCPSAETLRQKYPNLVPEIQDLSAGSTGESEGGRVYCTMPGDTLFGVARQQLGQASRYMEIAELNRNILGRSIGHLDPLPEGLKIRLPKPAP